MIQTRINGQVCHFDVHPDESAVEVIRERAGLTGTKLACGGGVCGACTVLLDGEPVTSCLLPAQRLEGRTVQTIEGLSEPLHPVQRAFVSCDALQCGFCTPGFVTEGIAFFDAWRANHGQGAPSREVVAEAMAGHLCRCGAQPNIFAAIQRACAGDFEAPESLVVHRVEALEKVTGAAKYTVDVQHDGQLEGRILRSPHPHARVRAIHTAALREMPGVRAIVPLIELPATVRYVGQEIVAVAAVDRRTAEEALRRIEVEYEILPATIGMSAARTPGAPEVYPGFIKRPASSAEGMLVPGTWKGNVRKPLLSLTAKQAGTAQKRIEAARAAGDTRLVEGTWQTSAQVHSVLEPHAAVARWEGERGITVYASTQACDLLAREVAEHFKLPVANVRVLCHHIGGAFGAKLRMTGETIAAIRLSRAAGGTPVRVVLDRLEEMTVGGYRPAADIHLAVVANQSGELQALGADVYGDGGVSIGTQVAVLMGLIYPNAPHALNDYDVVNHAPPATPFRGPGGPLTCWALEQAVDAMAHRLGESPVALRRRWDDNPLRHKLYDWAETIPAWRNRPVSGEDRGRFRRGVGLAAANWFYFYHPATQIEVRTSPAGLVAQTAAQDMGNGSRTVIARAVAEIFHLPITEVQVQIGDSQTVRGPLSGGSRTTNSVFPPAQQAATRVRDQLVAAAVARWGWREARAAEGGIRHAGGFMPWAELFRELPAQKAVAGRGRDKGLPAMPLAIGADDLQTGRGFTGAVHVTEVEVDTRLGKIRPLRVWAGLAVGRIIAPVLARSQCEGAVIQGLGYALYEARQLDLATGNTLTGNLEDYRIPGIGDIPEIEIAFLEEGFDHAEGRGVGLSELATLGVAASVGNAIFNATGWRPYHLPILPEQIIQEVR